MEKPVGQKFYFHTSIIQQHFVSQWVYCLVLMHMFRWTVSLFCGHLLLLTFTMWPEYIQRFLSGCCWSMCVQGYLQSLCYQSKKMFTLHAGPKEYLNNSTDSLKASVFIRSKVTGLIVSAGKSSWQLEVPPERAREMQGT